MAKIGTDTIPPKTLHVLESPQGNPRVPGAANADGTTHKGIDIGSDWGPKEGFGLPVGMRFDILVVTNEDPFSYRWRLV